MKGVALLSIVLRGHHLLCVHGFRGMGYSPGFVEKMRDIVSQIRDEQKDFPVTVVAALDDACSACPNKGEIICKASEGSNDHVLFLDNNVIQAIGLTPGTTYQKSDLVQLTAERIKPNDLDDLCKGCSWLSYGVCKEGISQLREKYSII